MHPLGFCFVRKAGRIAIRCTEDSRYWIEEGKKVVVHEKGVWLAEIYQVLKPPHEDFRRESRLPITSTCISYLNHVSRELSTTRKWKGCHGRGHSVKLKIRIRPQQTSGRKSSLSRPRQPFETHLKLSLKLSERLKMSFHVQPIAIRKVLLQRSPTV